LSLDLDKADHRRGNQHKPATSQRGEVATKAKALADAGLSTSTAQASAANTATEPATLGAQPADARHYIGNDVLPCAREHRRGPS
jgi:hypothetical protein